MPTMWAYSLRTGVVKH